MLYDIIIMYYETRVGAFGWFRELSQKNNNYRLKYCCFDSFINFLAGKLHVLFLPLNNNSVKLRLYYTLNNVQY